MEFFKVDPARCSHDGLCAAICPAGILVQIEDSLPTPIPNAADICYDCGACQSVCPHGAITLRGRDPDRMAAIDKALAVTPAQAAQLIKGRRSVRHFTDQPVPRETLGAILDVARYAPTGMNMQSVKWLVVDNRLALHQVAAVTAKWLRENNVLPQFAEIFEGGQDVILRDAPCLVLAYDKAEGFGGGLVDCVIAVSYLNLAAVSYGLGGTWAGLVMLAGAYPPLLDLLGLPADQRVYAAMMLGRPQYAYARIPERRPLDVRFI